MPSVPRSWALREHRTSDDAELARLLVKVDAAWVNEPFRRSVRKAGYPGALEIVSAPHVACVVAVEGGAIIGFATLTEVGGRLHLSNVFVDPERESLGVGRGVVTAMCDQGMLAGTDVYLEVLDGSTRAFALYESIGFRALERPAGKPAGREVTLMRLDVGRA